MVRWVCLHQQHPVSRRSLFWHHCMSCLWAAGYGRSVWARWLSCPMLYFCRRSLQGTKVTSECHGLADYGAADEETSFHQHWRCSATSLTARPYRTEVACLEHEAVVAFKAENDKKYWHNFCNLVCLHISIILSLFCKLPPESMF